MREHFNAFFSEAFSRIFVNLVPVCVQRLRRKSKPQVCKIISQNFPLFTNIRVNRFNNLRYRKIAKIRSSCILFYLKKLLIVGKAG